MIELATAQWTAEIRRYEVPVDDEWHGFALGGPIVHVAARRPDVVELWAVHYTDRPVLESRTLRVVGTGQPLPYERLRHIGTAITPDGALVWHLVEGRYPSRASSGGESA
jgi:hypothetical protein